MCLSVTVKMHKVALIFLLVILKMLAKAKKSVHNRLLD